MIIDTCANMALYMQLHPRLAKAFAFLESNPPGSLDEGRHEIEQSDIYLTIMERGLKQPQEALLEAHDAYMDIQIVVEGSEVFGWRDRATCSSPQGQIDHGKDILFFDDSPTTFFTLAAGQFTVFFPGDAHAPLVGEGRVRKCVVKVKI